MKKEILKRSLLGAPLGMAIGMVITIIISLTVGDGRYYAVVPELVNDMGNEINAVILQAVLSMIYGAAWAGASVVWDAEGWSLLKMTIVHLIIASAATFPIAYFARWMPHTLGGVLLYIGIFIFIYAGIWVSQYSAMKKRVKEMNEKIKQ
ncbi:MAG: DUF3021 domain-containing protein [Eubacteriales bacterium]|nr:DUF3021 domain-containing protein [Eubacteriales bacterium]